jgi:hypothetical protein
MQMVKILTTFPQRESIASCIVLTGCASLYGTVYTIAFLDAFSAEVPARDATSRCLAHAQSVAYVDQAAESRVPLSSTRRK